MENNQITEIEVAALKNILDEQIPNSLIKAEGNNVIYVVPKWGVMMVIFFTKKEEYTVFKVHSRRVEFSEKEVRPVKTIFIGNVSHNEDGTINWSRVEEILKYYEAYTA